MKGPEIAVGAALCGRPPVLCWGMFPRHPVGEGLAPPAMSREWPWITVGVALCGRPPILRRGILPHPSVGEGLAPPAISQEWLWIAVGAGPRPARPPRTMTPAGRDASQGFALRGDLLCPRRQRRQNAAGGGLRWASPPIVAPPPDPYLRGIPLHPSAKFPARKIWFRV